MNIENDEMEAGTTDLGLRLGYSSEFIQRTLNIESGAGVNAGLRINIPFVASSPLSELVWSPHKGLGIKCAERPSLLLATMDETPRSTLHVTEGNCFPINKVGIMPMGESSHEPGTVEVSLQLLHTDQEEDQTEELSNTKQEKISSPLDLVKGAATEAMNECEASNFPTACIGEQRPCMLAEESKTKMQKTGLESTDENDLIDKRARGRVGASESTKNDVHKDEEAIVIVSPNNSKVGRRRRKGKEKALSDGDVMSEDEDSSQCHGSVESCNSAGLFPTGKKRSSFEQLLMQSKRAKKEIQESPCSTSFARKDSSFMNWISNMVKGFGKPVEDKEPSTPLALAQPRHGQNTQDSGSLNMGFQSIFKSLYCSSTDPELGTKMSDIDATPIAYRRESGTSTKLFTTSNEKLNESVSKTESAKPKVLPVNSDSIQENCNTSSAENKNSYALVLGQEGERTSPKSSHKINNSTENNNSDLPSQGKTTHILSNRSDALGSLWITRFSTKTSAPLSHVAHHPLEAEEPLTLPDRELQNATNAEVSSGPERISDDNLCKLDSNLSSQRLKSSEAMASVFARRLDALKHIISSGVTDDAARAATTCFFCGIRGHHLRECPEIAETELDHLLRNINLHGGAEESSCLCIRCFQLDHWAVTCPNSLRELRLVNHAASLSKLQRIGQNKRTMELLDSKKSGVEFEPKLKHKLNETVASDRMISGSTVVNRGIASSSVKDESRAEQMGPLSRQMPEVPMGIFDAIKVLRVSRTDILKWMNSHTSVSCLNGFFLRLRLGKWEQGLGGTGYYVARIDGSELESLSPNSRNVIPVNVGSIKCLVESQYISNHDFREDELMAWWSATMRNGGEIPSIQDLAAKIKEKSNLHSCPG